jgi:hypothetical protein
MLRGMEKAYTDELDAMSASASSAGHAVTGRGPGPAAGEA